MLHIDYVGMSVHQIGIYQYTPSFSSDPVSIYDWHDIDFDILNQGHHYMHQIRANIEVV